MEEFSSVGRRLSLGNRDFVVTLASAVLSGQKDRPSKPSIFRFPLHFSLLHHLAASPCSPLPARWYWLSAYLCFLLSYINWGGGGRIMWLGCRSPSSHEPNRLYRFQFSNTLVTTPTNYLTCRMIIDILWCVILCKSFMFVQENLGFMWSLSKLWYQFLPFCVSFAANNGIC